jgi:hypothetical protein
MENVARTRINIAQDAKGFVKLDITAEYDQPELAASKLADAIDLARKTVESKGLKIVGETTIS